jgi:putative ABC transport system substrate-binding protein
MHNLKITKLSRFFVLILATISFSCHSKQSNSSNPRVAVTQFVTHPGMDAVRQGFLDEMTRRGFKSGQTITYDFSNANGDFPATQEIAHRIASGDFNLIFAISTPSTQSLLSALKQSHPPLVFGSITDPISAGIVKDLQHPGDSITGTTDVWPYDAQFNLLEKVVPHVQTVGVLYNPAESNSQASMKLVRAAAEMRHIRLVVVPVANSGEVPAAARSLIGRCDAIYVPADNTVISAIAAIVKIAEQNRLPMMPGDTSNIQIGGFGTIGHDYYDVGVVSGSIAARVLQGENAGDIPVATSMKESLFLNLRSAKAMGVTIPQELIDKAVKVYYK